MTVQHISPSHKVKYSFFFPPCSLHALSCFCVFSVRPFPDILPQALLSASMDPSWLLPLAWFQRTSPFTTILASALALGYGACLNTVSRPMALFQHRWLHTSPFLGWYHTRHRTIPDVNIFGDSVLDWMMGLVECK